MQDRYPHFDIIEEKPKAKRGRKRRPLFGYVPWRWVSTAFVLGTGLTIIASALLLATRPAEVAPDSAAVVTSLPAPLPTRTMADPIYALAWGGQSLIAVSSASIRVYPGIGEAPRFLIHEGFAEALAVSSDGTQAAALWTVYPQSSTEAAFYPHNPIAIWDIASGTLRHRIDAHQFTSMMSFYGAPTAALAFSADGHLLASGSRDGRLRVWDTDSAEMRAEFQTDGASSVLALAFDPEGSRLLAVLRYGEDVFGHDELRTWDVRTQEPVLGVNLFVQGVTRATFSPDARYLGLIAQGGNYVDLRDASSGQSIGQIIAMTAGQARALVLGPNQTAAIAFFWAGVATPRPGQPAGDRVELRVVHWSPGSDPLIVENIASREDYLSLAGVDFMHFSPDGSQLDYVSLADYDLVRWDLRSGESQVVSFW